MQTKLESILERCIDIAIAINLAWFAQYYMLGPLGWGVDQSFQIVMVMTVISFIRGYIIRRIFNRRTAKKYGSSKSLP